VSVVIPTYQRRDLVLVAIDSAFGQTVPPDEIVVVDDGSTDGTLEAVAALGDERVRALGQPNQGPSAARNRAIAAARSDIVAFLDSDNRWLPHHLAVIHELLRLHPDAVLVGTHRRYRFGDERPADAEAGDLAKLLLLTGTGVGAMTSVAARRTALLEVGGFDEGFRYGEDVELFLRLSLVGPMALISGRTVEIASSDDSLREEGQQGGAYLGTMQRSAAKMLDVLETSTQPDAGELREAALARRSVGDALAALDRGDDPAAIRAHLAEACRRAPELRTRTSWTLGLLPTSLPGWHMPERRLRLLSSLADAWPEASPSAVVVRAAAVQEAVRQRRWRHAAALARRLFTVVGVRTVAEMLVRSLRVRWTRSVRVRTVMAGDGEGRVGG
jgi:hypothetical protein